MNMGHAVIVGILSLLAVATSGVAEPLRSREILPSFSLRELAIRAAVIVVAEPANVAEVNEGKASCRFKAIDLLKGNAIKQGESFLVKGLDLYRMESRIGDDGPKPLPPVERALLFLLVEPGEQGVGFKPVPSGLRFRLKDGAVLRPVQEENPGPYTFAPIQDADWAELVGRVKESVAWCDRITALRGIREASQRNRTILKWIEDNRKEFGFKRFDPDGPQEGLGSLGWALFEWVMDSCIPSDSWKAALFYRELYGLTPDGHRPSFGSREGRELLLNAALDDGLTESDRFLALTYLSRYETLWAREDPTLPQLARVSREEADSLIDRITPLLRLKSDGIRELAVRVLHHASDPGDGALRHLESNKALPLLVESYRKEPPGVVRDALAGAVLVIGGQERWKGLTGNPAGLLITLYAFGAGKEDASFNLCEVRRTEPIYERPILMLSRLDEKGMVVEGREMPLPETYLPKPWEQGWDSSSGTVQVRFSLAGLTPGSWEVRVKGTLGRQKAPWQSEPKRFQVPP